MLALIPFFNLTDVYAEIQAPFFASNPMYLFQKKPKNDFVPQ